MELMRGIAFLALLFAGAALGAETRQAETCGDGSTHQAGYCPAVLSSASCSQTGATTGSCSATSDEADGTRYVCATSNNTALTCDQIQACSGGAAIAGASASETGSNSIGLTGLTEDAAHYGQQCNLSPEQWDSNGLVSASFTPTAPASGTNASRISDVLNGRTAPFTLTTPTDPTITDTSTCTSVTSASQFNNCADDAGTRITITASFSGNVAVAADDIDVIMGNAYTITGDLDFSSGTDRVRWTGGNIDGQINITAGNDVLFDDIYITTTYPDYNYIGAGGNDRVAFINSTLEYVGSTSGNTWVWFVLNSAAPNRHDDWFVGNVLFVGESTPSLVRFQSMLRLAVVDVVSNPTGDSNHGLRFHDGCEDVWVRDTWVRGDVKIDNIGSPTNAGLANIADATFDNLDVYNPGSITFTSYVDDSPQTVTNSGTVSNSTYNAQSGAGSFPTPTGFSDGGGNSQVAWDGSTVPNYSTVGAVR